MDGEVLELWWEDGDLYIIYKDAPEQTWVYRGAYFT